MRTPALTRLADATRVLATRGVEGGALDAVVDAAVALLGANHASLRLCEPGDRLQVAARAGEGLDVPPPPFRVGQGLLGWVVARGELANVADAARDPRVAPVPDRPFEARAILCVPVLGDGRVLGVLSASSERPAAFDEQHVVIAQLLADTTAQALVNAELRHLAVTDSQTLAFNRRHLLPRLSEDMERARRNDTELSLLLMDLDHFKRVNDRYGHAVGDTLLRAFADTVRELVRSVDSLVRRGGEEFVLILPDADLAHAEEVAERIRGRLAGAPLRVRADMRISQTVSIGVAGWDRIETPSQLDERADHAMYAAKRGGRNRVVVDAPGRRRISFIERLAGTTAPHVLRFASRR